MTTNPADEFAKDREICEKASPGPWGTRSFRDGFSSSVTDSSGENLSGLMYVENADFTCFARTRWPAALDEIARLSEKENEKHLALELANDEINRLDLALQLKDSVIFEVTRRVAELESEITLARAVVEAARNFEMLTVLAPAKSRDIHESKRVRLQQALAAYDAAAKAKDKAEMPATSLFDQQDAPAEYLSIHAENIEDTLA